MVLWIFGWENLLRKMKLAPLAAECGDGNRGATENNEFTVVGCSKVTESLFGVMRC